MKIRFLVFICIPLLISNLIYAASDDFYDTSMLRTLKLVFTQSDWWQQLERNVQSKQNIMGTLIFEDEVYDSVGIRFRGMTSYLQTRNSKKKSFNIELDWKKDQKLMGYEELNLINCLSDPTFMREPLFSSICREVLPSAKVNFITLEINGENWGVYANVQQLDGTFIREWFPSNDGTRWRGGNGFQGGGGGGGRPGGGGGFDPGSALIWKGTDITAYDSFYDLKNTNQEEPWAPLINTCDVLNNTPVEQLAVELPKVLDVDRALWLCAFEIVFHDDDGYIFKRGNDYYLYYEPESGRIHLIQYDANSCMMIPREGQWSPFFRADDPNVPLMSRLMPIPEYRQRYLAHIRAIIDHYLTEDYINPRIEAYREVIESEVKKDTKKLYSNQQFDRGLDELKSFVQTRRTFLLNNSEVKRPAPEILAVNKIINDTGSGQQLSISAQINSTVPVSQVNLFLAESNYGPFKSLPMFDDGLHQDANANDGIYGIELPVYARGTFLRYYIQAIANDDVGTMTFEPFAEYLAEKYVVTFLQASETPIVINEIMAKNSSTIRDPQGEYDDWIELKNVTSEMVDLSGMYLSDKLENPLKWKILDETQIEPNSYLIIWADEDGSADTGLHANFKLSADGETVLLFNSVENGNTLLDSISFVALSTEQSFGRYPDASKKWQIFSRPTPGAPNEIDSSVMDKTGISKTFQVWPAYPNPFNPGTTISFSIPTRQKVRLTIFNTLGQEITKLVDDILPPGHHSVQWLAENMPSGLYFYQFRIDAYTVTKKIILMK